MTLMQKKYFLAIIISIVIFTISITNLKAQTSLFATIESDGIIRDYKIYVPTIYDGTTPVPLVFNFHGYGSDFIEQEQYGDFRAIADTANFILVHPNGTPDNFGTNSWNTFDNSTTNDIGFIANLIDSLKQTYNIDTTAIYSTGMSNGGFMSYELACQLSERIAAVASVTGSITNAHLPLCNAQHPMPVLQIHGTNDGTVPYTGNIIFQPIENVVNYWIQFNNCDTNAVFNPIPDVVTTDNCAAEHYVYSNGNNGVEVEFYKIINGGHSWPGAPINLNTTNMDFQANQEIWRFFRKYRLGGSIVTSTKKNTEEQTEFVLFPNPTNLNVNINFTNLEDRKIEITNVLGQLINSYNCKTNQFEITLEKQGIYFISVTDNFGNRQTKKVVTLK
jgi:polyhydroxybutyrate depolymerase